jgi:hypothetical protein
VGFLVSEKRQHRRGGDVLLRHLPRFFRPIRAWKVRKRFLLSGKSSLRSFAGVVEFCRFSSVGNFVAHFEWAAEKPAGRTN